MTHSKNAGFTAIYIVVIILLLLYHMKFPTGWNLYSLHLYRGCYYFFITWHDLNFLCVVICMEISLFQGSVVCNHDHNGDHYLECVNHMLKVHACNIHVIQYACFQLCHLFFITWSAFGMVIVFSFLYAYLQYIILFRCSIYDCYPQPLQYWAYLKLDAFLFVFVFQECLFTERKRMRGVKDNYVCIYFHLILTLSK